MSTPLRIVIPGGSGQVGTILARHFHAQGHAVTVLARHEIARPWRTVIWDAESIGGWASELEGADVLINLAGRSVNCRYNAANRTAIKESRVRATRLLGRAVAESVNPPAIWLNASTATIYRHAMDRAMDERSGELGGNELGVPSTWRFSIDVARSWEKAFFEASAPRTRKIALRSAMVMSPDKSGVFDTLLQLVRVGLGGTAGSGTQYVSWIHDADFVRAIDFLITRNHIDGVVNVASPNPLPNREFMRILREARGIRIGIPAPRWMLEIGAIALRTETELLLKSRRVVPGRLLDSGFAFSFPDWPAAARNLVGRSRAIGSDS
jgi:uncharacterized protein